MSKYEPIQKREKNETKKRIIEDNTNNEKFSSFSDFCKLIFKLPS